MMIINVPILTDGRMVYADLTRIGLGNVRVTLKPNARYLHTGLLNVEGYGGNVDLKLQAMNHSVHCYDMYLVVVSGPYKDFRRKMSEGDDRIIISLEDFREFFHVMVECDKGEPTVEDIDLKTIHNLKDQLYFYNKEIY